MLGKYVDQAIPPLDQALSHGGRPVVRTVYQELQALFDRVDQWTGPDEEDLAGPMQSLGGLLTRERDAVEVIRKERAETIRAYLALRAGVRGVPDGLGESVREWRRSERSVPIQHILDALRID